MEMEKTVMVTEQKGNGMAVTSLVLGIVGLVLGLIPIVGWFLMPAWILAIIFGAVGIKQSQSKGMSYTGLSLGIVTIIYKIGFWLLVAAGVISSTGY